MSHTWKKWLLIATDVLLAAYVCVSLAAPQNPAPTAPVCTRVDICIDDEQEGGFITTEEVKATLAAKGLYPLNKDFASFNIRAAEELLKGSPFVKTAQCSKSIGGGVDIVMTQRLPVVRIKADNGEDYYVDDNDRVMSAPGYTSDMVIATGAVSKAYASSVLSPICKVIAADDFWNKQIVQLHVLRGGGIEIVPRVGDHIIYMGVPPGGADRKQKAAEFAKAKLARLGKFYRYGLSESGWNKYEYINLEYDNQVICKKRKH